MGSFESWQVKGILLARQMIHMKYQPSFSLTNKKTKTKMSSVVIVIGTLRVKMKTTEYHITGKASVMSIGYLGS